ncbi:MAG: hypothetical protein J6Z46_05930 [Lachnospiraceae bacterium]|nr:hypothetical protein [Lachnospiraceae bacterium]
MSDEKRRGLSASVLKTIALVTMFIDHLGGTLIYEMDNMGMFSFLYGGLSAHGIIYRVFRIVGRIAFVIFAFLLAEGYDHTTDRKKYTLRLMAGALISEIPYDLMNEGKTFDIWHQNVFFTLLIGLCTVWVMDSRIIRGLKRGKNFACIGIILCGMLLAELVRCDYGLLGIGLVVAFHLLKKHKLLMLFAGMLQYFAGFIIHNLPNALILYSTNLGSMQKGWEMFYRCLEENLRNYARFVLPDMVGVLAALILVLFYDRSKGRQLPKVFYYVFYPVHMLILYAALRLFMHFV